MTNAFLALLFILLIASWVVGVTAIARIRERAARIWTRFGDHLTYLKALDEQLAQLRDQVAELHAYLPGINGQISTGAERLQQLEKGYRALRTDVGALSEAQAQMIWSTVPAPVRCRICLRPVPAGNDSGVCDNHHGPTITQCGPAGTYPSRRTLRLL